MDKKHTEAMQRAFDAAKDYYGAHAFASLGPEGQCWSKLKDGHPLKDAVVALQRFYQKLPSGQNGLPDDARRSWIGLYTLSQKKKLSDADSSRMLDFALEFKEWLDKQLELAGQSQITMDQHLEISGLTRKHAIREHKAGRLQLTVEDALRRKQEKKKRREAPEDMDGTAHDIATGNALYRCTSSTCTWEGKLPKDSSECPQCGTKAKLVQGSGAR